MGAAVVERIEALAARLERLAVDLRPRPEVDRTFSDLVDLVLTTPPDDAAAALAHPVVRRLRRRLGALAGDGEHQLELAWARRVAAGADLPGFPYLDHYRLLVEAELAALAAAGTVPRRVLFVGSGPLPLSPMLLAGHGLEVDALDRDPDAVAAAEPVAAGAVRFHVGNLLHHHDGLAGYDLAVLAALVGEKERCLRHLAAHLPPGATVVARSARGLRTLLYPRAELPAGCPLRLVDVVHPPPPVINSIVVARVAS